MKRLTLLTLPILALASLASCGGGDTGPTYKAGDRIYKEKIYFDISDETAGNASIYLGVDKTIKSVKLGRNEIKFGYRDKILTLTPEDLRAVGAGEKTATVTFEGSGKASVDIFNATKFIKTAQDFQDIGKSKAACQGYYVLANDIDCSSISNFEPIGQFYSEEDPRNFYFHGILDGDGYAIKNINCSYSDNPVGISGQPYQSNYDVYSGRAKFSGDTHKAGDNIGIFQIIGSSGVVRNIAFDNCRVHGRTIVGVIAGNLMGTVENVLIKENCSARMDTHFYDDDCNVGAAFGIIAGAPNANPVVRNVVSLTTNVSMLGIYEDYDSVYVGKIGNGWDHSATQGNTDAWWRFAGVTKSVPNTTTKIIDSNGNQSNGVYSFAGKCWGTEIHDSVAAAFTVTDYDGVSFPSSFTHTHDPVNKPGSGSEPAGETHNCGVFSLTDLKSAATYTSRNFTEYAWNIVDGSYPSLVTNINRFDIAK